MMPIESPNPHFNEKDLSGNSRHPQVKNFCSKYKEKEITPSNKTNTNERTEKRLYQLISFSGVRGKN